MSDVRRIGKALGFEAESCVLAVNAPVFAAYGFQHIAGIKLYAFRIRVDRHRPARFGIAQLCNSDYFFSRSGNSGTSGFSVVDSRDKAVVVTRPRFFNIAADAFFFQKIVRRILYGNNFSGRNLSARSFKIRRTVQF